MSYRQVQSEEPDAAARAPRPMSSGRGSAKRHMSQLQAQAESRGGSFGWSSVRAITLAFCFFLGVGGLVYYGIQHRHAGKAGNGGTGAGEGFGCNRPENPIVILVSMDGFRHDYVDLTPLPNIMRLKEEGLHVKRLIPVFVSKTFPNHYTLVTGLYPESHGIVDNEFFDPDSNTTFSYHHLQDDQNPYFWGGEPIWTTARKNGMVSACFFWPGSEVKNGDKSPNYAEHFDDSISFQDRVDHVLGWLDLPQSERPSIITLYFEEPDRLGHSHGAASTQVIEKLQELDNVFGRLLDGISARHLDEVVSVILLADHGMQNTTEKIYLDDYAFIDLSKVEVKDLSTSVLFYLRNSQDQIYLDDLFMNLTDAHPNMTCYKRADIPSRFHYSGSDRIGDLGCFGDATFLLEFRPYSYSLTGAHGYDNEDPDMSAIFFAKGPMFPKGQELETFRNINIYNLLCTLLGISPAANNGTDSLDLFLKSC